MNDALTIAAVIAAFAAFALVAHWVTSRYQRFMNAPIETHDPRVVAVARVVFRVWGALKFWAWTAAGVTVGAMAWGLWGAVLGLLGVWFVMACQATARTH